MSGLSHLLTCSRRGSARARCWLQRDAASAAARAASRCAPRRRQRLHRALLPGLTVSPQRLDNDLGLVIVELQCVRHDLLLLERILGIGPRRTRALRSSHGRRCPGRGGGRESNPPGSFRSTPVLKSARELSLVVDRGRRPAQGDAKSRSLSLVVAQSCPWACPCEALIRGGDNQSGGRCHSWPLHRRTGRERRAVLTRRRASEARVIWARIGVIVESVSKRVVDEDGRIERALYRVRRAEAAPEALDAVRGSG
jgi:hypothetical protein